MKCLDLSIKELHIMYMGKFDVIFILKTILDYNELNNNYYKYDTVCRDGFRLKLKIMNNSNSITILDSYRILSDNLKDLCINYNVDVHKGDFPYDFSKENTLFYKGQTPKKIYYSSELTDEQYKDLYKEEWDFKKESLSYLSNDLISLYKVLVKMNQRLFLDFNIDMTKSLTISKLAYEIFSKDYYIENDNPIPLINKKNIYNDIKLAYYGGMTEVYKAYGKNLYYYDVNSLYPYVGLNDMPGLECYKQEYLNTNKGIDELFGFFLLWYWGMWK